MAHLMRRVSQYPALKVWPGCVRFRSTAEAGSTRYEFASAKPFNDMPHKKGYPIINHMPEYIRRPGKAHEIISSRHQELGPIFREKNGVYDSVFMTDVEALGDFLRQEGKYPMRPKIQVWDQYRKDSGEADGVLTADGQEWQRMRSVVDKPMMKIKTVESYADSFNIVAAEFLDRLASIRGPDGVVENIDVELFNWSLESICTLLYNKRMGCLTDNRSPDSEQFVKAVRSMLETTIEIAVFPPWLAKIIRPSKYREFTHSWDTIFRVARQCVDEAMVKLKSKTVDQEEVGFLEYLLLKDTISTKEIYANVTELNTGAVDTTSNTIQFILYEIAKNPDVQKKLREELELSVPHVEMPTPAHLRSMPYLKAVIKETLRLYPVGSFVGRVVPDDIVVMGYQVPKGKMIASSLYVTGRLPSMYDDPLTFRPERWMRESRKDGEKPSAFSHLPFGFGPRMCIGRRVAELEIQLLISQMLQRFDLVQCNQPPPDLLQFVVTRPKDPVKVKLVDRQPETA
ncbi:1,25-dihydroxyvitamin D(3) 24-hydroxylase, mitochondrial-like [Haliotis cracherodii]|uniref:1,25-dihydroxyvitamin D(3) 24-hydroxylase, mitochondrial-like n=1 Tax=Haliotis cracherodii TaxID=6455 RepID=UPI0039EC4A6A